METTFLNTRRAAIRPNPIYLVFVGVAIIVALLATLIVVPSIMRGGATGSAADRSYDLVEQTRVQFGSWRIQDSGYDQREKSRLDVVLPNAAADHSYDGVEGLRSGAGN